MSNQLDRNGTVDNLPAVMKSPSNDNTVSRRRTRARDSGHSVNQLTRNRPPPSCQHGSVPTNIRVYFVRDAGMGCGCNQRPRPHNTAARRNQQRTALASTYTVYRTALEDDHHGDEQVQQLQHNAKTSKPAKVATNVTTERYVIVTVKTRGSRQEWANENKPVQVCTKGDTARVK